jgi:hypothetical protein
MCLLGWFGRNLQPENDAEQLKATCAVGSTIWLTYCFLQSRDGLLVRPHPGFWRIVHGVGVLYLVFLGVLFVNSKDGAVKIMQNIGFPEIGIIPDKEENSDMECELTWLNFRRQITEVWFLAHSIGWWGKMCMFRSWGMCAFMSFTFEICELAFQFMIPEFKECWWDSVIVDFWFANMLGMWAGSRTLRFLKKKPYAWENPHANALWGWWDIVMKPIKSLRSATKAPISTVKRAVLQFTPYSWSENYHYQMFENPLHFILTVTLLGITILAELNAFFLMNALHIPKESIVNTYRLLFFFAMGLPSFHEYNEFLKSPKARLGQNVLLLFAIVALEVMVWLKHAPVLLERAYNPPADIATAARRSATILATWFVVYFGFVIGIYRDRFSKKHRDIAALSLSLFALPLLPLGSRWVWPADGTFLGWSGLNGTV